jgi:hypothetical protein
VLGAIVTAHFSAELPSRLAPLHLPAGVRGRIEAAAGQGVTGASGAGGGGVSSGAVRRAVSDAFMAGIHSAYLVSGTGLLVAALLAVFLLRPRVDRRREGVAGEAALEPSEVGRPLA